MRNLFLELLEAEMTAGTVHQYAGKETKHLTDRDEFKLIQRDAPDFAKKLVVAWEGDARDFSRSPDKFDPLFPKMLDEKAIKKFAPSLHLSSQQIGMLNRLHSMSFPAKLNVKNDKSPWGGERWVREAEDEYEALREELNRIIQE